MTYLRNFDNFKIKVSRQSKCPIVNSLKKTKKYLQVLFVTKQTNNSKAITFKTISGEKKWSSCNQEAIWLFWMNMAGLFRSDRRALMQS